MGPPVSQTWIVGIGAAGTTPVRDDVNTTELAWEAVRAALGDAGVELREVEGGITASQDAWEGRTISSMSVNEIVGGTLGSEAKVAADAVLGLTYAMARIEDGDQHLNIVLAHNKESQAEPHGVDLAALDPYYHRGLDPDDTVAAGLQAGLFYRSTDFDPESSARVVVAARGRSEMLAEVSVEDVLSSPPTASPLRALDRAPYVDAAHALVICDAETKERLGRPGVRLVAGASRAAPYWTDRDLTAAPELAEAVDDAIAWAGWDRTDLDRIDLTPPFAHQHLLLGRALGLGDGEELIRRFEGDSNGGGALNPSGGRLAGSPETVAGLAAVVNAAAQLKESGGRALVHGTQGICAQSHSVVLLEGER